MQDDPLDRLKALKLEQERRKPQGWKSPEERAQLAAERARLNAEEKRSALGGWGAAAQTFSDASTFGLSGLAIDALNAALDKNRSFREERDFRKENKAALSGPAALAAGLAGSLANPVTALLGPAKLGAGVLRTLGKGAAEGALQGAASAVGENIGSSSIVPEFWGSALLGAPLGSVGAGIARRFAGQSPAALQRVAEKVGLKQALDEARPRVTRMDDITETAARQAQKATRADVDLGATVPAIPRGPGMPELMEIDVAGPTALAYTRGAAESIPGRRVLEEAIAARAAKMPDALTGDVPDAIRLERQLREQNRVLGNKEFSKARLATAGKPIQSESLSRVLESPTGKRAFAMERMRRENQVAAGTAEPLPTVAAPVQVEPAAPSQPPVGLDIRNERGQLRRNLKGVHTDALEEEARKLMGDIAESEGRGAFQDDPKWANYLALPSKERIGRSKGTTDLHGNRIKKTQEDLPTGDDMFDPDELAELRQMASQHGREKAIREAKSRAVARIENELKRRKNPLLVDDLGIDTPQVGPEDTGYSAEEMVEALDAEALHGITRRLRKWAGYEKTVPPTGAAGMSATEAADLMEMAKKEFPEVFQEAIRKYAGRMKDIDVLESGRARLVENPAGKRTFEKSLAGAEESFAKMPEGQQKLYQTGKTFDIASRIRSGRLTPAKAVEQLRSPSSPLSRELVLSGSDLGRRLQAWGQVEQTAADVLPGRGEAIFADPSMLERLGRVISSTQRLMGAKVAREALDSHRVAFTKRRGAIDEAFMKLMTQSPGARASLLAQLNALDAIRGTQAARGSAVLGRLGAYP